MANEIGKSILKVDREMTREDVRRIWVTDTAIWIELHDGQRAFELFSDYAPLAGASREARSGYVVSHYGLHWPDIDEDLSFDGFFSEHSGIR